MVNYAELNGYVKELEALRDEYLNDWDLFDKGRMLKADLEKATESKNPGYICSLYASWIDEDRPEENQVMTGEQRQIALLFDADSKVREAEELLKEAEELRIEAHKYN